VTSDSEQTSKSPRSYKASGWYAHRRRPAFLLLLLLGLVLSLAWIPANVRISLWMAISAQRSLFLLLFIFALVTLSLIWSAGQRLDTRVFTLLNIQDYPKWLDRFMWLITQLGNMLAALMAALLFYFFNYRSLAIVIVIGTFTVWLLVEIIKAIADRDRPFLAIDRTRVIGLPEKGDSFPSGHTTQIFFLITLLIHHFQLGLAVSIALYIVAVLVGFTRIYVGAHYPRDIIAGMVLGSVWGILAALVDPYWLVLPFY
jgi:membrane-associated phospholipid phosphatase